MRLDFGLAKLKESNASQAASLPTQELTREGRIVGTVAYMSPEQAEAKPVDPRSDLERIVRRGEGRIVHLEVLAR